MRKLLWGGLVSLIGLSIFWESVGSALGAEVEVIRLGEEEAVGAKDKAPPSQTWRLLKVLRAEVAAFQKDWPVARKMVQEVEPWLQPGDGLYERLQVVKKQLPPASKPPVVASQPSQPPVVSIGAVGPFTSGFVRSYPHGVFQLSKPFLVLLPLSGPYEPAGKAILSSLKKQPGFKPLDVIDTTLFSTEELVNLVHSYQPQWLLGPLRPEVAQALLPALQTLPVLSLTSYCPAEHPSCYPLTPSLKETALQQLNEQLNEPALVVIEAAFWQTLSPATRQWLQQTLPYRVLVSPRDSQLKLAEAFNLTAAQKRYQNLRWLFKRSITPLLRLRRDIHQVLILGSVDSAYQVRTLLKFWRQPLEVTWLPTQLFSPADFQQLLPTWPTMQARLFPFFAEERFRHDELGIFRAVGETVQLILSEPTKTAVTPLGILHFDAVEGMYRLQVPWVEIRYGRLTIQQD